MIRPKNRMGTTARKSVNSTFRAVGECTRRTHDDDQRQQQSGRENVIIVIVESVARALRSLYHCLHDTRGAGRG
jgi:hypothetical protein